jgi:hypothetical protein
MSRYHYLDCPPDKDSLTVRLIDAESNQNVY